MAGSNATVAARRAKLQEAAWKDLILSVKGDESFRGEARRVAVHVDDGNNDKDVDEDVSGCPEALLPGALTRRLSACRSRLTLPPSSFSTSSSLPTSLPPAPPSYLRLVLSVCLSPFVFPYFFLPFTVQTRSLCFTQVSTALSLAPRPSEHCTAARNHLTRSLATESRKIGPSRRPSSFCFRHSRQEITGRDRSLILRSELRSETLRPDRVSTSDNESAMFTRPSRASFEALRVSLSSSRPSCETSFVSSAFFTLTGDRRIGTCQEGARERRGPDGGGRRRDPPRRVLQKSPLFGPFVLQGRSLIAEGFLQAPLPREPFSDDGHFFFSAPLASLASFALLHSLASLALALSLALLSRGHSVSTRATPLRAREWRLSRLARPYQRASALPSSLPACFPCLHLPTCSPACLSFSFAP